MADRPLLLEELQALAPFNPAWTSRCGRSDRPRLHRALRHRVPRHRRGYRGLPTWQVRAKSRQASSTHCRSRSWRCVFSRKRSPTCGCAGRSPPVPAGT